MTPEEARGIAARAWRHPHTKHIEMDATLAEAFTVELLTAIAAEREACARLVDKANFYPAYYRKEVVDAIRARAALDGGKP
jgi:hypothetical protein